MSVLLLRLKPITETYFHVTLAAAILFCASGCRNEKYTSALTPDEAPGSFELAPGFKIDLFAAEPLVADPVEMVFNEHGDAFVVEMPDYPYKPEPGNGLGRINVLLDTNNDFRADRSIIFADSLSEATSVLPWQGGLLVTSAPYILFLKDTNSDYVADIKEILFSGFFENNSEAQITSLRMGVDNWIYAANNGQPGEVRFHRRPDAAPLKMNGADFRFRLERGLFELETGAAQFGHTLDDWGNRFITQNTLHIRQIVIPWRYLHRHDRHYPPKALENVSDHDLEMFQLTPPPYWRAERTRRRQQQYAEQGLDRVEYAEDHFTGCSGGMVYDGDAFPSEYYGNVFTGDVAGNLVHRDVLVATDNQVCFVARRAHEESQREFLASTDPWFRPAGFTVDPQGALCVVDMYRQHIETPLSIPEDLKEDMDFLEGSNRGRIYRITYPQYQSGKTPPAWPGTLEEWVSRLEHPARWWRLTAQRLLIENGNMSVLPSVEAVFNQSRDARSRLHALYTLEGLNGLARKHVEKALTDPHPGVRKHGVMLAERFPDLLPRMLQALEDSVKQVVFQATLSLGNFEGPLAQRGLVKSLAGHGQDPWFLTAILSAPGAHTHNFLKQVVSTVSDRHSPGITTWLEYYAFGLGAEGASEEIAQFLNYLSGPPWSTQPALIVAALSGLTKGLEKSPWLNDAARRSLSAIQVKDADINREAIRQLRTILKRNS